MSDKYSFPVHPSVVPYWMAGKPYIRKMEFQPPEVQSAAAQDTSLHKWLSEAVVPLLQRSGRMMSILSDLGYDDLDTEKPLAGEIHDIPIEGTSDLLLWKDGKVARIYSAQRASRGNVELSFEDTDGRKVNYLYQLAPYAEVLRNEGKLADDAKLGAAPFEPAAISYYMNGWDSARNNAEERLKIAEEAIRYCVKRGSNHEVPMPSEEEFHPGGRIYNVLQGVADEMNRVYAATGMDPNRLSRQDIPRGYEGEYQILYERIDRAQRLIQGVGGKSITAEQAENHLGRLLDELKIKIDTSEMVPVEHEPEPSKERTPELCRFYGIVIFMNYTDHDPPHFHARYQDQEITLDIQTGTVRGTMSRRALRMLFEWSEKYQEELLRNWERAKDRKPFEKIAPLV